jgi:hypothetical protein
MRPALLIGLAWTAGLLLLGPSPSCAQTLPWQHQLEATGGPQLAAVPDTDTQPALYGGALTYYYRASRNLFVSLSGGYYRAVSAAPPSVPDGLVPVLIGGKFNFSLVGLQPYVGAEAGVYVPGPELSRAQLGVAPKVGLRIPLAAGFDLDLDVRYQALLGEADLSFISTHAGFAFSFGGPRRPGW